MVLFEGHFYVCGKGKVFFTNKCVMTVQFLSIDSLLSSEQSIVYLDI